MTSPSPAPLQHPFNRGLAAWIDAGSELADCTAPSTAEVGAYAHRLAIPGSIHPTDGEQRYALKRTWHWHSDRLGWRRTA